MIKFAQPLWIVAGVLFCICFFITQRILLSRRQKTLDLFVSPSLRTRLTQNVSLRRRNTKIILSILSIFCCFLALARPQYGFKWVDVKHKGIDILFAIDTSKSMLVEDIKPNRLERSKLAIMDFVSQLGSDRVGLLPFAGSAYLMCPLTSDYMAFEQSLNAINSSIIPLGGTDIGAAIEKAGSVLSNDANHKILVLITDGENLEGDSLKIAEQAAQDGMKIFPVGVGTTEGELIPLPGKGKNSFQKDAAGKFVTSRLDEATLTKIAEATDALYVPLGSRGEGLETIYQEKLTLIPKEELSERRHKVPLERFEWPLAVAILFLIIECMLGGRKTAPLKVSLPFSIKKPKSLHRTLALFFLLLPFTAMDSSQASMGETAFENEDYITASEYYSQELEKDPENVKLHYNYGAAAYKNNLFDDAISSFNNALKTKDLDLQERAYYNRGNAQFRKGAETQQSDPQATIKQWREAVTSYTASLELAPEAKDSLHNRQLVEKKLEELEKQKDQEEQKQDQNCNNQENQEKQKEDNQEKNQDNQEQQKDEQTDQKESNSNDQKGDDPKEKNSGQEKEEEKKEPEQKQATPENGSEEKQPSPADSKIAAPNEQDKEEPPAGSVKREPGKMTKEEAMQLLDGLRSEEDALNFVPSATNADQEPRRDW